MLFFFQFYYHFCTYDKENIYMEIYALLKGGNYYIK